jgi:hypothetical protein
LCPSILAESRGNVAALHSCPLSTLLVPEAPSFETTTEKEIFVTRSVNKVIVLGHLGRDADTKFTPSGAAMTKFGVATSRRWKDSQSDEWKEETDWHNIVLWRSETLANFLTKGKQVYVERPPANQKLRGSGRRQAVRHGGRGRRGDLAGRSARRVPRSTRVRQRQ